MAVLDSDDDGGDAGGATAGAAATGSTAKGLDGMANFVKAPLTTRK